MSQNTETSYPKSQIKILLLEGIHQVAVETFKKSGYENIELLPHALPEAELIKKLEDVRLIGIRSKTQLTEKVLQNAPKLLAVGCFCIGTNQVDLDVATKAGIAVFNSPYSNTRSVAELVIAEIIMLLRRIPEKSQAAHKGVWLKDAKNSFEARGKILGIIGYGNIGMQVGTLAEAMGMNVHYYDVVPKLPLGNATAAGSLDELLEVSDIVTLHIPADPSTHNMIGAEQIAKIKKGALLLNLSRGTVVDLDALSEAMKNEHITGAAIDVYPVEPKSKGEPFGNIMQNHTNVILTPHIGGSTKEAQQNIGVDAAQKLVNYLDRGSTTGCHTIPELNLQPTDAKHHRILHIHKNVPGVLSAINTALSNLNVNIMGQYLKTNESIGYVVLDVDKSVSKQAFADLKKLPSTIRARELY